MAKKKSSTKKPATKKPAATQCAKGGAHEWEQEDGGTFCKKCHEAQPQNVAMKSVPKLRKGRKVVPKGGALSAIDAAVKLLGETKEPMNAKGMIEAMSAKGYWNSPGGKTPWATLYSAILTEIIKKGKNARFKKTERGHFTLQA